VRGACFSHNGHYPAARAGTESCICKVIRSTGSCLEFRESNGSFAPIQAREAVFTPCRFSAGTRNSGRQTEIPCSSHSLACVGCSNLRLRCSRLARRISRCAGNPLHSHAFRKHCIWYQSCSTTPRNRCAVTRVYLPRQAPPRGAWIGRDFIPTLQDSPYSCHSLFPHL
jgi:hypothetical protein